MSDPGDGGSEPPSDVGSLGEEAAKLLGALGDWAQDVGGAQSGGLGEGLGSLAGSLAGSAASAMAQVNEHLATGQAECRYCPVCRTVHAVRQSSPEVRAHLVSAATSFLQAAAGLVASLDSGQRPDRSRSGDLQHIDLDEPDSDSDRDDGSDPS